MASGYFLRRLSLNVRHVYCG